MRTFSSCLNIAIVPHGCGKTCLTPNIATGLFQSFIFVACKQNVYILGVSQTTPPKKTPKYWNIMFSKCEAKWDFFGPPVFKGQPQSISPMITSSPNEFSTKPGEAWRLSGPTLLKSTLPKTNSKRTRKWAGPQKETRTYSNHPFSGAKMLVWGCLREGTLDFGSWIFRSKIQQNDWLVWSWECMLLH